MIEIMNDVAPVSDGEHSRYRKSAQAQMPFRLPEGYGKKEYDIYPGFSLGEGKIFNGYETLAQWILQYSCVIVDGFSGVLWDSIQSCLTDAIAGKGKKVKWTRMSDFLKPAEEVEKMVAPFLGERESVWGTKTTLQIEHFFQMEKISQLQTDADYDCEVIIGAGAALVNREAPVIYLDVPKNEIQYRMRAGSVTNLGLLQPDEPAFMYKQYYFVDWVVLTEYRDRIADRIVIRGDVQWEKNINWLFAKDLSAGLSVLAQTVLRVRPWFEPGAWGGQWMKERIKGLNKEEVNYAWSFELIVPENGLVFESDGYLLEVPFDLLMAAHHKHILGRHADFFGKEFPIRFDFLDTWEGGNLSIQCHPSLHYIRDNFGEQITQDETYYILDCKPGAKVFLGFQDAVEPAAFRKALEDSKAYGKEIRITDYVQELDARKHDLFLIPNGTVHSAGANNLVLEISSTPYIFTFKMYDWVRMDLNGVPRAINIDHAFKNLRFERQGKKVQEELIAQPALIQQRDGAEVWHLPTHKEHFYDVHRLEFEKEIQVETNDSCNVLMLVEGESITIKIGDLVHEFYYAETFVIPAAVGKYRIINNGAGRAKVVKAFIKESIDYLR